MGLNWDEGPEVGGPHAPYFQSQRSGSYQRALNQLLDSGKAYRDFEPAEETRAQKEAAEKDKRQYVSSRVSVGLSPAEIQSRIAEGIPHVYPLPDPS